ncbi:MAG: hypothetical protein MUF71_02690 [Candidatus Kapabacteria bacterium]|jgi:hypothetical protein|nr:hypothetical protein [Candidatus Kapabacteria bacterium]
MKVKTPKYRVLCHILVFFVCLSGLAAQTTAKNSVQMEPSTQASVQVERTAKKDIFAELLGNGIVYSVNYEWALDSLYSCRIGFMALPLYLYFLPITASYFIGQGEHRFEIGGGGVPATVGTLKGEITPAFFLALRIGYRYQPLRGGFNFAATFTPFWDVGSNFWLPRVSPWGGISLGWGF